MVVVPLSYCVIEGAAVSIGPQQIGFLSVRPLFPLLRVILHRQE